MLKKVSLLVFLVTLSSFGIAQEKEENRIRKCFEKYRDEILANNGDEAANYVASKTIEYYTYILDKAIKADSNELNELGFKNKFEVLLFRHWVGKDKILTLDGRGLLVLELNEGMIAMNTFKNQSIGKIEIDGSFAKGRFLTNNSETIFKYHFYKEDSQWKVDLSCLYSFREAEAKQEQIESGQNENDYMLSNVEMLTGKKVTRDILNPLE